MITQSPLIKKDQLYSSAQKYRKRKKTIWIKLYNKRPESHNLEQDGHNGNEINISLVFRKYHESVLKSCGQFRRLKMSHAVEAVAVERHRKMSNNLLIKIVPNIWT